MPLKTFIFGQPFKNEKQLKKAIDAGVICCYVFAVLGLLISVGGQQWIHMIDVAVLFIIGFSIQKWKSRTAAVFMLIGALLDGLNRLVSGAHGYLITMIVMVCALKAIKGTFYYWNQLKKA